VSGLTLAVAQGTLAGYLLAMARVAGFVLVAPPFNTRSVPMQARAAVVLAVALPLTAWTTDGAPALDSASMLLWTVLQLLMGAVLGFLVLVAVAAVQAVGDLLDLVGGFSLSLALDPLQLVQTSVLGRLNQLLAVVLLFVTDGHLIVLQGLIRSLQVMPRPTFSIADVASTITSDVGVMMLAAVQVAAPLVAASLLADIALGLLTKAAPALNAFALGFPLKILITLLMAGLVMSQMPDLLHTMIERAGGGMLRLTGG
jgi:flagellar biosynthesis protein FliR